jgi:hypothetical protein
MGVVVNDQPNGPAKQYPIPEEGMSLIVLADVEDLGVQPNEKYGARREVALTWVVDQRDSEGNFYTIRRKYNATLNEGSFLFADIRDMFGKNPPKSFDLELAIGRTNNAVITHALGKGAKAHIKYANIKAFMDAKGQKLAIPSDFVRGKDGGKFGRKPQPRTNATAGASASRQVAPPPAQQNDDDIPF